MTVEQIVADAVPTPAGPPPELPPAQGAATEVDAAGADGGSPSAARGPAPNNQLLRSHGLTNRQIEVVRLVVEGKTNREIAEALVVSERTVTTHLDHIFHRLGVSSRTAVATFALRNDVT